MAHHRVRRAAHRISIITAHGQHVFPLAQRPDRPTSPTMTSLQISLVVLRDAGTPVISPANRSSDDDDDAAGHPAHFRAPKLKHW